MMQIGSVTHAKSIEILNIDQFRLKNLQDLIENIEDSSKTNVKRSVLSFCGHTWNLELWPQQEFLNVWSQKVDWPYDCDHKDPETCVHNKSSDCEHIQDLNCGHKTDDSDV